MNRSKSEAYRIAYNAVMRSDRAKPNCKTGDPCGSICIPKSHKCRQSQSLGSKAQSAAIASANAVTTLKPTPKLIAAGVGVGAIASIAAGVAIVKHDVKRSSVDFESIRQPPGGIPDEKTLAKYDTFEPGDLIRRNFKGRLGQRTHYAVYIGKDPKTNDHMLIDTGVDWKTRDNVPMVRARGLTWSGPDADPLNDTEYEKVPDNEMYQTPNAQRLSREKIVERAYDMLYQRFDYRGFESNCESFARAIVEGDAYSVQARNVTPLTRAVSDVTLSSILKLRSKNEYFPGADKEEAKFRINIAGQSYEFTGLSDYAKDKHKMTARQIADYLAQKEQLERNQQWEHLVNPYSGEKEPEHTYVLQKHRNQQIFDQYADLQKGVPIHRELWSVLVRRANKNNRKDSVNPFSSVVSGEEVLRSPQEFSDIVEEVSKKFPSSNKEIKIELYKRYLMFVFTMFADIEEEREDASTPNCNTGVLCGNTCISKDKECREGDDDAAKTGVATNTPSNRIKQAFTEKQKTSPDYDKLSIRELKAEARDRQIYRYSDMNSEELRNALRTVDEKDPEQRFRLAKSLQKDRAPSQRAIKASGLTGNERKATVDAARTWRNIQAVARFADSAPVGWGAAAVGALLLGTTIRGYERLKGDYRSRLRERANEATELALNLNPTRTPNRNITFLVANGRNDSADRMEASLRGLANSDREEDRWLSNHHFVPRRLRESGSVQGGSDVGNVVEVLKSYTNNLVRKKDQDAVNLAADIYAHGIQRSVRTNWQNRNRALSSQVNRLTNQIEAANDNNTRSQLQAELERVRRQQQAHRRKNDNGQRSLVNNHKRFTVISHSMGGQTTKTAVDILSKMESPGNPSGKDILKQMDLVLLGSPHFGFSQASDYVQMRTIISARDPVSLIPAASGARHQWISTVKGHKLEDYLNNPDVIEAIRESSGYYQNSLNELIRKQVGIRRGDSSAIDSSSVTVRIDAPDCKKGTPCGSICIPKKHNCQLKKTEQLSPIQRGIQDFSKKPLTDKALLGLSSAVTVGVLGYSTHKAFEVNKVVKTPDVTSSKLSIVSQSEMDSIKIDETKKVNPGKMSIATFVKDPKGDSFVLKRPVNELLAIALPQSSAEVLASEIGRKAGINVNETRFVPNDTSHPFKKNKLGGMTLHRVVPGVPSKDVVGEKGGLRLSQGGLSISDSKFNVRGINKDIIQAFSAHKDLSEIVALDTFTNNWDRNHNNIFYDAKEDHYHGIDMGTSWSGGEAPLVYGLIDFPLPGLKKTKSLAAASKTFLEKQDFNDFSPQEIQGLGNYRDTLKKLVDQNDPKEMRYRWAKYMQASGVDFNISAKYIAHSNIPRNYKDSQELLKLLDQKLAQIDRSRQDSGGKRCGKGWIPSDATCRVNERGSERSPQKKQQQKSSSQKTSSPTLETIAAAGVLAGLGAVGGAAVAKSAQKAKERDEQLQKITAKLEAIEQAEKERLEAEKLEKEKKESSTTKESQNKRESGALGSARRIGVAALEAGIPATIVGGVGAGVSAGTLTALTQTVSEASALAKSKTGKSVSNDIDTLEKAIQQGIKERDWSKKEIKEIQEAMPSSKKANLPRQIASNIVSRKR